ncbi:hypothetical protein HDU67_009335 [Dinochytrium kinnereticum]|nr:hypothetical protein HDU67_009335 [Dinochytrium kinnereticum]
MTQLKHVVIITGGSKGIGKAVACELAKFSRGQETAIAIVDKGITSEGQQCVEKLSKEHEVMAHAFECDLAESGSAKKVVGQVVEKFGKVTAIVNNAAVYHCAPIDKITEEDYERVFNANVRGIICMAAAAIPHMQEGGSIVNISSAITHRPYGTHSLYTASKGAVEALTRSLAVEVAPKKIRVNTVSPGFTETDMLQQENCEHGKQETPFGRIGKVEDVAPVICFMLCNSSSWLTGQNIMASGGGMEQELSKGFYYVEALALKQPAGKPRHLEERFRARRRRSNSSLINILTNHYSANEAFIEERRSKLKRRHNHIQKVLTAHRTSLHADDPVGRQKIQETLKAAEMNRKSILDRQAKSCAVKVAHAREVAAAQAKKDEEAQLARRQALEDRLRASEARRRAYQSTPRSRLLHPNEVSDDPTTIHELSPLRNSAACSIQRWWRSRHMKALVDSWNTSTRCLTPRTVKGMSFDALIGLIQSQGVIRSASKILGMLWKMVDLIPEDVNDEQSRGRSSTKSSHKSSKRSSSGGSTKKRPQWKNPSRVFLSSFIIVEHTNEIMPTIAAEEETVKKNAVSVLGAFQNWLDCVSATSEQELLETTLAFLKTWTLYYESFNTWKERDTKKIVDDLVSHWMNLEKLWLSVKDQVDADSQWRPRIEQQQKVIINRLGRFGESALDRLREERRLSISSNASDMEIDEDAGVTSSATTSAPMKIPGTGGRSQSPMASSPMDILSTSPQRFPTKSLRKRVDSVNSPVRSSPSRSPSSRNLADERSPSRPSTPSSVPDELIHPSTNGSRSLDLTGVAASFGSTLSNEQLAHELTLDPDFALKKPQLSPLEESIRTQARRAFFDSVQQSFDKQEFSVHVPDFIEDIRRQILSMVSEKGKIAAEIKEVLDIDHIKQQIDRKVVSIKSLLTYIVTKMAQLCAPIRDSAMRAVTSSVKALPENPFTSVPDEAMSKLASMFDAILLILEDMKLDLANFRLQSLRPHLRPQAAEYEKKKFADALRRGDVTLDRTRAWLTSSAKEKEDVARARNPEGVDIPENRIRYTDIFHEAILGLVFSPPPSATAEATLPETLTLDAARLRKFQEEAQRLNVTAALLTLTQNAVHEIRGDRAALMGLKDALLILLSDSEGLDVDHLSAQIISSVSSFILSRRAAVNAAAGRTVHSDASANEAGVLGQREGLIRTMVSKILGPGRGDPILGLLRRRIQACVKAHVASGAFKKEGLERAGLDVIRAELEAFSLRVAIWVRFNGEVYSGWYDGILGEVVA